MDRPYAAAFGAGGVSRCEVPKWGSLPRAVPGTVVGVVHLGEFQFPPKGCATVFKKFEREVELVSSVEVKVFAGNVGTLGNDDGMCG